MVSPAKEKEVIDYARAILASLNMNSESLLSETDMQLAHVYQV
jgi:hypothetical protein